MKRPYLALLALILATCLVLPGHGQRGRRNVTFDRNGVAEWHIDPPFLADTFTFVRVKYTSSTDGWRWGKWATDYPDSDLNLSYRLQQLTSLQVNPQPIVLELTDPRIHDYPFLYLIEPGDMELTEEEVVGLRKYLLSGGFLLVDDFWGEYEWYTFYREIKRVFPDREPVDVPLEHEIFHSVYDLREKPQVPNIHVALRGRAYGITWERPDAREPHYRAIYDDRGRMMVFICHNTDLGDGWEREGVDEWYFHEFSEKKSYPLGINIIVYAMTH